LSGCVMLTRSANCLQAGHIFCNGFARSLSASPQRLKPAFIHSFIHSTRLAPAKPGVKADPFSAASDAAPFPKASRHSIIPPL
jgi:hypothetical protein